MPDKKKDYSKADTITKEAMSNIKQKIQSGEWGQEEIDKFMKNLSSKYKEITGKDFVLNKKDKK